VKSLDQILLRLPAVRTRPSGTRGTSAAAHTHGGAKTPDGFRDTPPPLSRAH
jgi:hypothetical protein